MAYTPLRSASKPHTIRSLPQLLSSQPASPFPPHRRRYIPPDSTTQTLTQTRMLYLCGPKEGEGDTRGPTTGIYRRKGVLEWQRMRQVVYEHNHPSPENDDDDDENAWGDDTSRNSQGDVVSVTGTLHFMPEPESTPKPTSTAVVEDENARERVVTTVTAADVIQKEVDFLETLVLREQGVEVDVGALRGEIEVLRALVGGRDGGRGCR